MFLKVCHGSFNKVRYLASGHILASGDITACFSYTGLLAVFFHYLD